LLITCELKALHEELIHPQRGITLQTHRYKLRSLANCCEGSEIVDWLLGQDKATSRMQAVAIGQALIDANYLECLSNTEQAFIDGYSLYRPKSSESVGLAQQTQDAQEPLWVRQIGMQEDTNHIQLQADGAMEQLRKMEKTEPSNEATATVTATIPTPVDSNHSDMMDSLKSFSPPSKKAEHLNPLPLLNSPTYHQVELTAQTKESQVLNDLFDEHTQRLMKQLLSSQGLPLSWAEVLMPLVNSLAFTVRPDVKNDDDDLDIRQYVHIKKVPGASKSDSRIIHGVVCSKNVANRSMPKRIYDPNILLLSSAIDYQRVENKLISLEPLMMQVHLTITNHVTLSFTVCN